MYNLKRYFCPLAIFLNNKYMLCKTISNKQEQAGKFSFLSTRQLNEYYHDSYFRMDNSVMIIPKEISENKKYINEVLRIPVFHGIINNKIQAQINNSFESDIMEFKKQLEESAEEYGTEAEKTGREFKPYVISNNYVVTYNKNNVLSLSLLYNEYIAGKQSYIRATYNYDLQTGKSLGLVDLFKPGVSYRDLIDKEIRRQLLTNKTIYPPDAAKKFKGITEDQPFYLENGNIVLFFGFNEIAPTISEIPVIRIPISTFKNEIKPMFL